MGEKLPRGLACNDGYPMVELDSDDDCRAESSDDELDVILHGTPEQKRRLRRLSLGLKSDSSEDEFEKEMAEELDRTMKNFKAAQDGEAPKQATSTENPTTSKNTFYDASYFDSESDEEETSQAKSSHKHPVISNDDLFYDPDIDDNNQLWVNRKRQQYQPKLKKHRGSDQAPQKDARVKPLPHSDAVLNCPGCMTVLCLDCQRHAKFRNQYRAMFVMNCSINSEEALQFPEEGAKKSKNKKKHKKQKTRDREEGISAGTSDVPSVTEPSDTHSTAVQSGTQCTQATDTPVPMDTDSETFNPVKCTICTTEVGVYDKDEVYHFFNVLASYA